MQRWGSKREMMGDDPPYLAVGTEVSAKYKGAFCEAKVRKIVRSVKCKIVYKLGLGTATVTDDLIKGTLRAGSVVEVRHSEKKDVLEATIIKIQDCSQYTVVFDDGDITTLRRTALCLKSGRHFAESETLDQLPLTHPEHFSTPVIGGRRGRRNRNDDSSDDEGSVKKPKQPKEEKEEDIGKVVCVEISEKKKQKDNWFPGLVVAPTSQDTVKINVKEDYLVRSFKDGRYYTVPKKEATAFTREIGQKVDNNTLRTAVEKALLFLDKDELPPHWDRELLFGLTRMSDSDSEGLDSDTSDDEPREEKDHFVAQLYKFMDDRGTPINKGPTINGRDVDLYKLFKVVHKMGGYNRVTNHNQWKTVSHKLGFGQNPTSINLVKQAYKKFLHSFEDFYRKLGCTMVNHPRGQRPRQRSNRSLIRDKDKALPTKDKQIEREGEDSKDPCSIETRDKDSLPSEEIKEVPVEIVKSKETRKEPQRPKCEKLEKKEDVKTFQSVSKGTDTTTTKIMREEKVKLDDREERIKLRDIVKLDTNVKDEPKSDKYSVISKLTKESKVDESQKFAKTSRRDLKDNKKDEKDDKSKLISSEREGRHKKPQISHSAEVQTNNESKFKKTRSLFSKITGNKRIKPLSDNGSIARTSKSIGLSSVRQKRSFSERMKAMVKKFKMKAGGSNLGQKLATSSGKDSGDKKKTNNEETTKTAVPQLTRSKSRDEFSIKLRKAEAVQEKKLASCPSTQQTQSDKKQTSTKKRKDDDKTSGCSNDEPLDILPNYKTVAVGDKLKVYYGPTLESKVTYEAKVLSMKEEDNETLFLVHYTGWNTRYDEWIKRGRIADNLSWTPGRAKRTTRNQTPQLLQQKPILKRSKSNNGGGGGGPRSTTPSSVTSSSSRTKSPGASSSQRSARSRARTRRASGHTHTDFSESSELDDDYESGDEPDGVRISNYKDVSIEQRLSGDEKDDSRDNVMDRIKKTYRSAHRRSVSTVCDGDDLTMEQKKIKDESEEEEKPEKSKRKIEKPDDVKKDVIEVHRSDRLKNKRKVAAEEKGADYSNDEKESELSANNDLKVIEIIDDEKSNLYSERSENEILDVDGKNKLKRKLDDMEEENKESQANERRRSKRVPSRKEDSNEPIVTEIEPIKIQSKSNEAPLNNIEIIEEVISDKKEGESDVSKINIDQTSENEVNFVLKTTTLDDIYEFKEPEPFEFEVRAKCNDDKGGKMQRRSFGRVCEEGNSTSILPALNTSINSNPPSPPPPLDDIQDVVVATLNEDTKDLCTSNSELKPEQLKQETNEIKTYFTPTENLNDSSDKNEANTVQSDENKIDELSETLKLFCDENEEQEVVKERDNLIISDTELEPCRPTLSHEEGINEGFFPSTTQLSSLEAPNSVIESSTNLEDEEEEDFEEAKKSECNSEKDNNNETDEDPILSAIQSAISQYAEDDDSNDLDILTNIPDPTLKMDEESSSECPESEESLSGDNTYAQIAEGHHSEASDDSNNVDDNSCKIIEDINSDTSGGELELEEEKEVPETEDKLRSNSPSSPEQIGQDDEVVESQESIDEITIAETSKEEIVEASEGIIVESNKEITEEEFGAENVDKVLNRIFKDDESLLKKDEIEETNLNTAVDSDEIVKGEVNEMPEEMELEEKVVIESVEIKTENVINENVGESSFDSEEDADIKEEIITLNETDTKSAQIKHEARDVDESNLESLLCEETIPGSPAPLSSVATDNPLSASPELPFASAPSAPGVYKIPSPPLPPPPAVPMPEAMPVLENTPPTTPEGSLSPISNSPIGERCASSPVPENECTKSNQESSEASTKPNHFSEEDTNCEVAVTNTVATKTGKNDENETSRVKKRRRSRKRSEDNIKRFKTSHRSPRHSNVGSDSEEDMSENSAEMQSLHSRSPRPSKYNFCVQLDPELDASQRIAVLQQSLADLRKTYMSVKAELAAIDRRRKKLRRRERGTLVKSGMKSDVPCS